MSTLYLVRQELRRPQDERLRAQLESETVGPDGNDIVGSIPWQQLLEDLGRPSLSLQQQVQLALAFIQALPEAQRPAVAFQLYRQTRGHGSVHAVAEVVLQCVAIDEAKNAK